MLDDLFTYRLADDRYLTVTNAANHERDLEWFEAHAVEFEARGPRPNRRLRDARRPGPARPRRSSGGSPTASCPPASGPPSCSVAGAPTLVCGTGYTGEDGVELLMPAEDARTVWDALIGGGRRSGGARRPRHAPARGQLLPLRQRPDRGADTDRGRSRLVRQGGHRLRRLGGLPGGPRAGAERGPRALRDHGCGHPAAGQPDRRRRRGRRRGDQRNDVALARGRHRDGLRPQRTWPSRGPRSRSTSGASAAPPRSASGPLYAKD